MKETQKKDTIRLIRGSFGRFFSLTAIITIGVAFFVGVSGSAYLMGKNTDRYMKDTNFRDIAVYSDYGFDDEDIEAIEMVAGVKKAEGSRFADVIASSTDTSRVVRVHEYDPENTISRFVLKEGRLPQNKNEAVAEAGNILFVPYAVGDKLTLSRPDGDLEDYLNVDEVTIVGLIDTPTYINETKETSTLSNQYIKSYLYMPSDAFELEIDTEVNVITEDGKSYYAFSDDYYDYVSEIREDISNLGIVQAKRRSDSIIADAEAEYNKALLQYESALEQFNTGIEEGKQQLEDAEVQIADGESQIADGKAQLASSQATLNSEYASNKQKIQDGYAALDEAEAQLKQNEEDYAQAFEMLPLLQSTVKLYDLLGTAADSDVLEETIAEAMESNEELKNIIESLQNLGFTVDLSQLVKDLQAAIEKQLVDSLNGYGMEVSNMEDVRVLVNTLSDAQVQIQNGYVEIESNRQALKEAEATLESSIASGQAQIDAGWQEISDNEALIARSKTDLSEGRNELETQETDGKKQLDEAKEELDKARQDIDDIAYNTWTVLDRDSFYGIATYKGSVEQMNAIGNIFPVFFFLVAALVCLTTMTRMIDEERGQIGILRALGYTKLQCLSKYLIYSLSATAIGCILGSILGTVTFPVVIYQAWRMLYIEPPMHIYVPWSLIIQAAVMFCIVMAGTTFYVCWQSMNAVPASLMRPASPKLGKSTILEKAGFLWNRLSFTWKVTVRNLIRYKRRFIMTVIGVGGCSALMVMGFGIRDSINQMVQLQFDEIIHYAGSARISEDLTSKEEKELMTEISARDEVDDILFASAYSGIVTYGETDITTNVQIFENDEDIASMYDLRTREKHNPISISEGVVISEKMSDDMGVSVGDEVTVESKAGVRKSVKITGICEMYIENYCFMSAETYKDLYGVSPQNNALFMICDGDSSNLQKMLAGDERITSISFMDGTIDNFNSMVKALDMIILVIIAASMALSFVVLGNLMNINISERQREIATLKVLGFRKREVQSYIYKENNILTLCGAVFGIPLGIALHHWIMKDLQFSYVMFGVDVMPASQIISVVLTLAFGMLVNQLMKKKLAAIEMVESLKSVE